MIDWGFWGAMIAIAAMVVGAAVAVAIYFRSKATSIAVSATFDETGLVHVLINKKGTPPVHVRDVKLLRAGTNNTLPIRSRKPAGEFDIEGAGPTAYDCFCLVVPPPDDGVDVQVWLGAKAKSMATATQSEHAIKLPDGVKLQ